MGSGSFNDGRFWANKRMFRWVNAWDTVCPAFSPVTFTWDNEANVGSPWQTGGGATGGFSNLPPTMVDGQIALPGWGGYMSEAGYALTMYAINGPFDVQPGGYGHCSIDYPLPVLYDPESFPIPIDPLNPAIGTVGGTWDDYISIFSGDIEGPPPMGFSMSAAPNIGFQPATFSADFILWTMLYFWPNPDASTSDNIALVVPGTAIPPIPTGGSLNASTGGMVSAVADVPIELLMPLGELEISRQGLYEFNFSAVAFGMALSGITATFTLRVTYGPAWDLIDLSGTPGAPIPPPVSGQTVTLMTTAVKTLTITIGATDNPFVTINNVNYAVQGDDDQLVLSSLGSQTAVMSTFAYLLPGDVLTLDVTTDTNTPIEVIGGLNYYLKSPNPFGSFAIYW